MSVKTKYTTPFRQGVSGGDFLIRFKRTHKLILKKPQSVEACRKMNTDPFIISEYFEILREVTNNISARQIWNLRETMFMRDQPMH
jgi:hypothetical protein